MGLLRFFTLFVLSAVLALACAAGRRGSTPTTDSGTTDARMDTGTTMDTGAPPDTGARTDSAPMDTGTGGDAAPVCAPATSAENTNALCGNGLDDDGDGLIDCADRSCSRHPSVDVCQESNCSNGLDDDGDGFYDCADFDCAGSASCPPPSEGGGACDNMLDDDGDGFVDCADFDCNGFSGCAAETNCTNAFDDDGDGFTDCDDFDCQLGGSCPGLEVTNATCDDGMDNDGNGFTDCDDSQLRPQPRGHHLRGQRRDLLRRHRQRLRRLRGL